MMRIRYADVKRKQMKNLRKGRKILKNSDIQIHKNNSKTKNDNNV